MNDKSESIFMCTSDLATSLIYDHCKTIFFFKKNFAFADTVISYFILFITVFTLLFCTLIFDHRYHTSNFTFYFLFLPKRKYEYYHKYSRSDLLLVNVLLSILFTTQKTCEGWFIFLSFLSFAGVVVILSSFIIITIIKTLIVKYPEKIGWLGC